MSALQAHAAFLRERIFQTATKWPHYERLLADVAALGAGAAADASVVILERAYVYGGDSLFAPFFPGRGVTAIDCEIKTTKQRDGYQKSWTEDPRCIHQAAARRAPIEKTGLPGASADLLLVPNVVHHVSNQDGMFAELARLLKPGGTGYIFEALLRELHQAPDDYIRYTPWGFREILSRHGLEMTDWKPVGGPFEAITYCWIQALQYLPEPERARKEEWFYKEHYPELLRLDKLNPKNLVRDYTTFPVAYSVYFRHKK